MAKIKLKDYVHRDKDSADKYIAEEMPKMLKELRSGLDRNLTFDDQFNSFQSEVEINAFSEKKIRNQLKIKPTEWWVMDATGAPTGCLTRGTTKWTDDYLYLTNTSNLNGTFKIRFFQGDIEKEALDKTANIIPDDASEVHLDTGNGMASTDNKIRRFSNTRLNTGSAITYADSAANGATFTINENGIYAVHYSDFINSGSAHIGISVNSSVLTTNITSVTYDQGKRIVTTEDAGRTMHCTWTGRLVEDDVVRPHCSTTMDGTSNNVIFKIMKIGV